ncbi:alanine dehydrogenase, partial [Amycolatopsis bartoniae]
MRIAVPREIKKHEYRVALTPAGVHELTRRGHEVFVETEAGVGSAIPDDDYTAAGAKILATADEVWAEGELVLKVKEPIAEEYPRLRENQTLFTYLHLAADRPLTEALLASGTTAIAYETVQLANGSLPLLAPMSEVAGRLAPQVGAFALMKPSGGRGVLPGGVPGVRPAKVVVIGGGVAGLNAARVALGLGSEVEILDTNVDRLRQIDQTHNGQIKTVTSTAFAIEEAALQADLIIGAVLIPGAKAPKLITNDLVSRMKPGSVLVDIAIDQGGCFE